MDQVKLWWKSY
jgi:hypothetical protein